MRQPETLDALTTANGRTQRAEVINAKPVPISAIHATGTGTKREHANHAPQGTLRPGSTRKAIRTT